MSNPNEKTGPDHLTPDPDGKIHWANSTLEEKLDVLRSRNWISEDLIQFSQKHWHCTREEAVQRLLSETHP